MAILQVRDFDDRLYEFLKRSAKLANRSISQEVITIIQAYLSSAQHVTANATDEFIALTGAWKQDESAAEIVSDLRHARNSKKRFGDKNGLFD